MHQRFFGVAIAAGICAMACSEYQSSKR